MHRAEGAAAATGAAQQRAGSVIELIGNTPLLDVSRLAPGLAPHVRIYAKLEGFNPGGSVKDRAALWMVRHGLETGALQPGKTIIDSTSGNTGIALAMIGAALGYPVTLVMPENVSRERKTTVHAFGAQTVYSSGLEGSDGAIILCRTLIGETPQCYFKPDQYNNALNPQAHYESTGPEIWEATQGRITHFVASIGTGGTIMGTGRYLKERNPAIQVIAAEPDDALHGLEGLKHMATSIVPGIYHEEELDRKVPVPTDAAYDLVYQIGATAGMVVGQSSGAALHAARVIARDLTEGVIVVIFPDFGDRYLSTNLWVGWKEWLDKRRGARRA